MKKIVSIIIFIVGIFLISTTWSGCKSKNAQSKEEKTEKDSVEIQESIIDDEITIVEDYSLKGLAEFIINSGYSLDEGFRKGIAQIKNTEKYGAINKNGEIIVPPIYDILQHVDDNHVLCHMFLSDGLLRLRKGDQQGFVNSKGEEIVPFIYDSANEFHDGLTCVSKDGKYGYINKTGEVVVPIVYDRARDFCEGLGYVEKESEAGFIDKSGNMVIPLEPGFVAMSDFDNGVAIVKKGEMFFTNSDDKYGLINKSGKILCLYDIIEGIEFHDGLISACRNEKYGFIDRTGKEMVPCKYGMVMNFHDGIARVYSEYMGDNGFYIDTSGREIIPIHEKKTYDSYGDFYGNYAQVEKNGECGIIDKTGKEVISCKYEKIGEHGFCEGLLAVKQNGKWGFIDENFKEIIPLQYEDAKEFEDGLATVKKNGKWGCIFKSGNEAIPFIYDNQLGFSEGLALVKKNGVYGFVGRNGKSTFDYITEADMSRLEEFSKYGWLQGHWVYEQGNYKGFFIIEGNTITQYSSMNPEHVSNTFRIEGDEIKARLIEGMDLNVKIDFKNKRIDYGDGNWMHKVN